MQRHDNVKQHVPENIQIGEVVSAIGDTKFESCLLTYLNTVCGAEHFALMDCSRDAPVYILAGTDLARFQTNLYIDKDFWRFDDAYARAKCNGRAGGPSLVRMDVRALPFSDFRELCYDRRRMRDRLLLSDSHSMISLVRSERRGIFTSDDCTRLEQASPLILSLLKKHSELIWRHSKAGQALSSLDVIEDCILMAPEMFSRREAQVCARIILGMTSTGIGLDLGISEQTAATYRRRAYQRLSIACQRELFTWYLARWGFGAQIH